MKTPDLPERYGNAAINDPMGFKEHPDFERTPDQRGLVHKPTGMVYLGTDHGKEVWV